MTGPPGTARMHYELRKVLQCLEADVLGKPEVFIGMAAAKFDDAGRLVDDTTRGFIAQALRGLAAKTQRNEIGVG
jgi:chromate reductase